jgi:hypothetical protein
MLSNLFHFSSQRFLGRWPEQHANFFRHPSNPLLYLSLSLPFSVSAEKEIPRFTGEKFLCFKSAMHSRL